MSEPASDTRDDFPGDSSRELQRVLEPEVMDSAEEASDYNNMDHSAVNQQFVDDLLGAGFAGGDVLDVGTGTALIPIELLQRDVDCRVMAIDMSAHMLDRAKLNLAMQGFDQKVQLAQIDAKNMDFQDNMFDVVISNSIIHHLPEPEACLRESVRVVRPGGLLFFRDLLRPDSDKHVEQLVQAYAGEENEHSRQMFDDSLRAALSLDEVRSMISELGLDRDAVQQTTDRHWTWFDRKLA